MYVHSAGVADVFIAPDMVQELFSCKNLVRRGCQEIEKFQLLGRHLHGMALVKNGIIGQVYDEIRVFHIFALLLWL